MTDLTRYAICAVGDRVVVKVDPHGPYVLFEAAMHAMEELGNILTGTEDEAQDPKP
jgi:hypothetical protein